MYDVIICGASFAGLAVASKLRGKVLLVDKKVIGSLKSSACATPLHILEERGLEDSVLSITDKVNFTTMYGKISYRTIMPFAVFDYEELCRIYLKKLSVDFIKANIKDFKGDFVRTNKGDFSADIYVDATGWRAKLASGLDKNFINKKTLGFGIETEVNYKTDSLNFFYNPKILKNGYAWIFPSKSRSKFGVGSYLAENNLKQSLELFLDKYGLKKGLVRGGYMPYGQRKPVIGNVFLAGDSAGKIAPVTGEGIRQSIIFGEELGKILQKVIQKEIDIETAKIIYMKFLKQFRKGFFFLQRVQGLWAVTPNLGIDIVARTLGRGRANKFFQKLYFGWIDLKVTK